MNIKKPVAKTIGKDGNIYNIIAICMQALEHDGQKEKAKEMHEKVEASGSYHEALSIMMEYVNMR